MYVHACMMCVREWCVHLRCVCACVSGSRGGGYTGAQPLSPPADGGADISLLAKFRQREFPQAWSLAFHPEISVLRIEKAATGTLKFFFFFFLMQGV